MRYYNQGPGFRVLVFALEVEEFQSSWPCSGLEDRSVWFEFASNGDLIDTNASDQHPDAEGGAILALSQDAYAYGKEKHPCPVPHVSSPSPSKS